MEFEQGYDYFGAYCLATAHQQSFGNFLTRLPSLRFELSFSEKVGDVVDFGMQMDVAFLQLLSA